MIDSDYDGAEKYRSDYLSGSPTVVKGKLELDAKITVDKNRVDKRNSNALDGNNKSSLLDKVRSGEVLKHEFGHFLYNSKSTDPNTGVINGNSKIDEKEARKIENTFDGEEDTQTNTEDYEPPKK